MTEATAQIEKSPLPGWVVVNLAIAETLVWAGYYYAFPALLLFWEQDLGWSRAELTFAFTASLVTSAIFSPVSGRLIDKGLGPQSFAGSAVLGGILITSLSFAQTYWQFLLIWIGIGIATAGSLYEPCFSFVTRCGGAGARKAITRITLVAGLAGTVSFPSAHFLNEAFGWRTTVVVFGMVVLCVAVPLIWISSRHLEKNRIEEAETEKGIGKRSTRQIILSPTFILLAIAFTAAGINHNALTSHILPILGWRGIPADLAVIAASCIGPMQVFGRLMMVMVEDRVSMLAITHFSFAGLILSSCILLAAGGSSWMFVALFVMFQGASHGVTSIAKPVVMAELLGRKDFGLISGMMAVPFVLGFAVAPFLSSAIWQIGGYEMVVACTIALATLALVSLVATAKAA